MSAAEEREPTVRDAEKLIPSHVAKKANAKAEPVSHLAHGIIQPGRMRPVVIVLQFPETYRGVPFAKVWNAVTEPGNWFRIMRGIAKEVVNQLGEAPLPSELVEQVERAIIRADG